MEAFFLRSHPLPEGEARSLWQQITEEDVDGAYAVSMVEVSAQGLWSLEVASLFELSPTNKTAFFSEFIDQFSLPQTLFFPVELSARDWVAESLKGLHPVHAGRFFLYGSHDRARRPALRACLEIEAATAFGSGHHGTTQGCLIAFDTLLKKNKNRIHRVLDVGCGTGVLALAALKALPFASVIASDCDPEAVKVTKAHAQKNECSSLKTVVCSGVFSQKIRDFGPYDLIFANILARPLVDLAPSLAPLLAPGGHIILSGLTTEQSSFVLSRWRFSGAFLKKKWERGFVCEQAETSTHLPARWVTLLLSV